MQILDALTNMAKTRRLGPVFSGARWSDVAAALGEPWGIGTMSRNRRWPRLFAYEDLELSVCFTFEIPVGEEPVLNVMGLPGDGHGCSAQSTGRHH